MEEIKNPEDMFVEPVKMGTCPLCNGDTYSESNPSNDYTMAVSCCKCRWTTNQFMTWDEMNNI